MNMHSPLTANFRTEECSISFVKALKKEAYVYKIGAGIP
jgi:hypothetical protein